MIEDWKRFLESMPSDALEIIPGYIAKTLHVSPKDERSFFDFQYAPGYPLGYLPNPMSFLIMRILIDGIKPKMVGEFRLHIGNKLYAQSSILQFCGEVTYRLSPELMIAPLQQFRASIYWDGVMAWEESDITVSLQGQIARAVQ